MHGCVVCDAEFSSFQIFDRRQFFGREEISESLFAEEKTANANVHFIRLFQKLVCQRRIGEFPKVLGIFKQVGDSKKPAFFAAEFCQIIRRNSNDVHEAFSSNHFFKDFVLVSQYAIVLNVYDDFFLGQFRDFRLERPVHQARYGDGRVHLRHEKNEPVIILCFCFFFSA